MVVDFQKPENLDNRGEGLTYYKTSSFFLILTGSLIVEKRDNILNIKLAIEETPPAEVEEAVSAALELKVGEERVERCDMAEAIIPDSLVSNTSRAEWWDEAERLFRDSIQESLRRETLSHFVDVVDMTLIKREGRLGTVKQVIARHLKSTTARFRETFGIKSRGKFSPWAPTTLTRAIVGVVQQYPREDHSYANVVKRLQQQYPDKAPPSADALKKLVKRMGLNWSYMTKVKQNSG